MDENNDRLIQLVIDGNEYSISMNELSNKKFSELVKGINYKLNITVNKSSVNVEAYITDWLDQILEDTPSNGQEIDFSFSGTDMTDDFSLYMSEHTSVNSSWDTGYMRKAEFTKVDDIYTYKNKDDQLYWPDNKTFYHFRALCPDYLSVKSNSDKDYVDLKSEQVFIDVVWGAPYIDNNLSQSIGATKVPLKFQFSHKMAQLKFVISTTTNDDKVSINNSNVELKNYFEEGKLLIGSDRKSVV